jgi:DNA-binding transcriptional MerR regulator
VKTNADIFSQLRHKQYISTIDAAKLCGVSTFSIQRWFDEGLLIGAKLPGGKRKIEIDSLRRFMKEHNMISSNEPLPDNKKVLVLSKDARLQENIKEALIQTGKYLVQAASSGLDAGLSMTEFKPNIVIIDLGIDDSPPEMLIQRIKMAQS